MFSNRTSIKPAQNQPQVYTSCICDLYCRIYWLGVSCGALSQGRNYEDFEASIVKSRGALWEGARPGKACGVSMWDEVMAYKV